MPDNTQPGSLSRLIPALKEGNQRAVQKLWEHYFQPLVRVARSRVHPARWREVGPEDIALEAFLEFCDRLAGPDAEQRFPQLHTRAHLWKLLVCFTVRAAFDFKQKQDRRAEVVRGESALGSVGLALFPDREPAPEFASAVTELLDQLQDDTLRAVALRKMEGHTVAEIARELDCSASSIERKLRTIRAIWKAREEAQ